eukprot:scaffold1424_cov359-Prasinococcus_capsulatus_cf.AAC.8
MYLNPTEGAQDCQPLPMPSMVCVLRANRGWSSARACWQEPIARHIAGPGVMNAGTWHTCPICGTFGCSELQHDVCRVERVSLGFLSGGGAAHGVRRGLRGLSHFEHHLLVLCKGHGPVIVGIHRVDHRPGL